MDMTGKKMLVVGAHPGDVLWRCSGAIAKHVKLGGTVEVIVVTYGTGGEANELFKAGYTIETAKKQRFEDFGKAMDILGVSHWDEMYQFVLCQKAAYFLFLTVEGTDGVPRLLFSCFMFRSVCCHYFCVYCEAAPYIA